VMAYIRGIGPTLMQFQNYCQAVIRADRKPATGGATDRLPLPGSGGFQSRTDSMSAVDG
jgi:hypothetical protein